jgi:rhamnopyranosyl-N-acetylglucosaminyl-diphospho-decaprenol beta-1,3/1,4-galactofuranosyltransferase
MGNKSTIHHVTTVILSYNSINTLIEVIEAVKQQTYPLAEIIIVDNGSDDGTQAYLKEQCRDVTLLLLAENSGVGAGHNYGWQAALKNPKCEFIWSLEHDAVPADNCLAELIQAYHNQPNPALIGAILPTPMADHVTIGRKGTFIWKNNRFIRSREPDYQGQPYLSHSLTFNGALFHTQIIRSTGFLQADFFLAHEDFEYARRLKQRGLQILMVPSATIAHDILKTHKKIHFGDYAFVLPNQSLQRTYYGARNAIFLQNSRQPTYWLVLKLLLKLPFSLIYTLLLKDQKLRRIQARLFSIRDGLQGNLGRKTYSFLKSRH